MKELLLKRKKLIIIIVVVLVAIIAAAGFFLTKGKGGDKVDEPETIDPPQNYEIGEAEFTALPVIGDDISVYIEEPESSEDKEKDKDEDKDDEESDDSEGSSEESDEGKAPEGEEDAGGCVTESAVIYRYEGFHNAKTLVSAYTDLMTSEDGGFVVIDEYLNIVDPPDFEADNGSILLARADQELGTAAIIGLTWSPEGCVVTANEFTGEIKQQDPPEPMSISEAGDYMRSISPAKLGLEGNSMQAYKLYIMDGMVLVDGQSCIRVNICSSGRAATNEAEGHYFLAADRSHIYKLDVETGRPVVMV